MADICLVHLVRAHNQLKPFQQFIQAYSDFPAGVEHDLIFVFKGFRRKQVPPGYLELVGGLRYDSLFVTDIGFDIRPYGLALESFRHRYFCFINSFSRPLEPDWLEKLNRHIQLPNVGLVGATGSWESMYSNAMGQGEPSQERSLAALLWLPFRRLLCRLLFKPFPNWHLRTNAFIISREVGLRCWPRFVATKRSAYLFEAGKRSLTARVTDLGLDVLVVGRDGRAYRKEEWAESRTHRSGNQENLLVADTQTDRYAEASPEMKRYLARVAWGPRAHVD